MVYVLGRYGFGERLCDWMKHWIATYSFLVLVKGTLVDFFNSSCGLRQGNLLSLFLFVLVMDVLSRMLEAPLDGHFMLVFLWVVLPLGA